MRIIPTIATDGLKAPGTAVLSRAVNPFDPLPTSHAIFARY